MGDRQNESMSTVPHFHLLLTSCPIFIPSLQETTDKDSRTTMMATERKGEKAATTLSASAVHVRRRAKAQDTGIVAVDVSRPRSGLRFHIDNLQLRDDGMEDEDALFQAASEASNLQGETDKRGLSQKRKNRIRFSLDSKSERSVGAAASVSSVFQKIMSAAMSPFAVSTVATAAPSDRSVIESPSTAKSIASKEERREVSWGSGYSFDTDASGNNDDGVIQPQPQPPDSPAPDEPENLQEWSAALETDDEFVSHYDDQDDEDEESEGPGYETHQSSEEEDEDNVEQQTPASTGSSGNYYDTDSDNGSDGQLLRKNGKNIGKTSEKNLPKARDARSMIKMKKKQKDSVVRTADEDVNARKNSKKKTKTVEEDDENATPHLERTGGKEQKRKVNYFSPKGIPGSRKFTTIPLRNLKQPLDARNEVGLRRSQRTKLAPLMFWKNEQVVFGPPNDFDDERVHSRINMPVPKAISKAEPTPYKPRKSVARPVLTTKRAGESKKQTKAEPVSGYADEEPFDSTRLRKKFDVLDGSKARLWDDATEGNTHLKVVARRRDLKGRLLPRSETRAKSESNVVGLAAQAFNVANDEGSNPGYVMGNLILPPRGIKDAESVGLCAQTFTVISNQPSSLEVAFGDPDQDDGTFDPQTSQRFLLSAGDMFRIPSGNSYRLENHSSHTDTHLTWTIIRPNAPLEDEASE